MRAVRRVSRDRGFTLIELLTTLLILSLLALMSFRGLSAVLDTRVHLRQDTQKWRSLDTFFARFERDVQLAAPRPVRAASGSAPAWVGRNDPASGPTLEFSRFTSSEAAESPRRLAYRLNEAHQIELWLWPGLDVSPGSVPQRYPVLAGVRQWELGYLDARRVWVDSWPVNALNASIPAAVQIRIVLASGEEIVRVFALRS